MKIPRRRKADVPYSAPALDPLEEHITVGSLSGIAPARIHGHVLLVVTHDGDLSITSSECIPSAAYVLATASRILAEKALADHDRGDAS